MQAKKNIAILGATGSIGDSTLDVVRDSKNFTVLAISGFSNIEKLVSIYKEFQPKYIAVPTNYVKDELIKRSVKAEILVGQDSLEYIASLGEVDVVMAAIVGIAGLRSTFAAAKASKTILLANKEALVTAGHLLISEVERSGAQLIPVDSEHNAIFQCLDSSKKYSKDVSKIVLTASGGPFRDLQLADLENITPEQACAHPNWEMGRKISVDSSTMVNKALEVVEAYWLFNIPVDNLEVIIHPQSVIHSMVKYTDGSYLAQMGVPDMKTPIANAMYYPDRGYTKVDELDLTKYSLTFRKACFERFEALAIVFDNLRLKKYSANIIFNAVNEELVAAFLDNKIKYLDIIKLNKEVLSKLSFENPHSIDEVFAIDEQARNYVCSILR